MVYIIDDDISIRRAFELFLESAELEFESYGSANEFLALAKPSKNDLIVLDISMPEMSGFDLLDILSQEKNQIPVIVVSAFDELQSTESYKKYGVKQFLRKPVDGEALIDLIKKNIQS